jgi:hypothetical protein
MTESIQALMQAFDAHNAAVATNLKGFQDQLDRVETQMNKPPNVGGDDRSVAVSAARKGFVAAEHPANVVVPWDELPGIHAIGQNGD